MSSEVCTFDGDVQFKKQLCCVKNYFSRWREQRIYPFELWPLLTESRGH